MNPDNERAIRRRSSAGRELAQVGAQKGGRARASVLTAEERSAIARHAVQQRWRRAGKVIDTTDPEVDPSSIDFAEEALAPAVTDNMPSSMLRGTLKFGEVEVECHVLSDGRRVLTQRELVRVLTGGRVSGNLGRYLENNPLATDEMKSGSTIRFKVPAPGAMKWVGYGYEGVKLIEICESYLRARDHGLLKPNQMKLAQMAEIIIRACAKLGIESLIDEATGFQQLRAKNALQMKLQAFIADDIQDWALMFPESFWLELSRIEGVHYSSKARPLRWGKYIMMFVYDAIDADVGRELRAKNPNPHFLQNHHQWLKKFGRDKVHDQIERVVTIMKLCNDMRDFKHKFARVFEKKPWQMNFDDLSI